MDKRTMKRLRKEVKSDCPSETKAKMAVALEMYNLGVPATRCGRVVERIWQTIAPMANNQFMATADGHYALSGVVMSVWEGNHGEQIRKAVQSCGDRKRVAAVSKPQPRKAIELCDSSMVNAEIPNYLDEKDSPLLYVLGEERLHISWRMTDGRILCVEHVPDAWPRTSLAVHDNFEAWHQAVMEAHWLAGVARYAGPDRCVEKIYGDIEVDGERIEEDE